MKAASLAAILAFALAATGAMAQTPSATTSQSPPAAPGEPQILNGPKPAEKPAEKSATGAEPYAGQKPPGQQTTATPAPPAATPSATAAPSLAAAEGAAAAAKAAASEAKSTATVPEGPAVKPISKPEAASSAAAKPESKPEPSAKPEPVPTLAKPEPPKPTLHVSIDLTNQKMTVSENGGTQYKWNISSGRTGYLTPIGTFRPVWMSKMWYSKKYDYAPMPNAIFFHGGAAIHGTDSVYALGRPASHGCVRLSPSNAATLYRLVTKNGKQKTQITVFGNPKQSSPVASNEEGTRRPRTPMRNYENEPWWNDDDDDMPPVPRRGVYGDRGYDDGYGRPSRYLPPPRARRYVRDYDSYGGDF